MTKFWVVSSGATVRIWKVGDGTETLEQLRERFPEFNRYRGDFDTIEEAEKEVQMINKVGMTDLMYADSIPAVELLLGAGASVNDKDSSGKTALYYATQRADPEVVRALIAAGADVNARDDKGRSALQLASLELRSDKCFSNQAYLDAYRAKVQKVIDLLVASGAKADDP